MITAKEIGHFIAHPEKVGTADLQELKSLSEKYPYSQIFSVLYLKGMQSSNSVDFEAALRLHSYRISDRAQLYALIKQQESISDETTLSIPVEDIETIEEADVQRQEEGSENNRKESDQKAKAEVEETVQAIERTLKIESTEEDETDETIARTLTIERNEAVDEIEEEIAAEHELTSEVVESESEVVIEEVEDAIQEEINPEELEVVEEVEAAVETEEIGVEATEIHEVSEEVEEEPIKAFEKPQDRLEETILHHAFATNYQLDALTEEEEKALLARQAKENSEIPTSNEALKIEESSEVKLEPEGQQTFTSWLHANRNRSIPETKDKEAIASLVNDSEALEQMESLFGVNEKPKQEFYSPAKKAKESLSEKQLPVSETLAKIYLMQGNYPKAIEAYKELSLAFPEKKIFFANQIEDLNKKLNK